jgi:hypothetical protein
MEIEIHFETFRDKQEQWFLICSVDTVNGLPCYATDGGGGFCNIDPPPTQDLQAYDYALQGAIKAAQKELARRI